MLYVFSGERVAARNHCKAFIQACQKKRKSAEYIHISHHMNTAHSMEELLYAQGLFEKKYIVFCDEVLDGRELMGHFLENVKLYAQSEHMFVLFEPRIPKEDGKKMEKAGAVFHTYEEKEAKKEDTKQLFGFVGTFMRGEKQKTLAALHPLLQQGASPMSIINILIWQVRALVLVTVARNQKESGLTTFPYDNAKRLLAQCPDPHTRLLFLERAVREGRVQGMTDEEMLERIVLFF